MTGTPLDQMYAIVILFGTLTMITGRAMHLAMIIRQQGFIKNRKWAYMLIFLFTVGLVTAAASIATPLTMFGPSKSIELVNQMNGTFQIASYILFVMHALLIPYFTFVVTWVWRNRDLTQRQLWTNIATASAQRQMMS